MRSWQRAVILVVALTAVVSLGLIGKKMVPIWFGGHSAEIVIEQPVPKAPESDTTTQAQAAAASDTDAEPASQTPPQTEETKEGAADTMTEETKEGAADTMTADRPGEADPGDVYTADMIPDTYTADMIPETVPETASATENREPPPVPEIVPAGRGAEETAEQAVLPEPNGESDQQPLRPYEESLPGDVYEPPVLKTPSRKPEPPKARRMKRNENEHKIRSKNLKPIARSQLPPWRRYAVLARLDKEDKDKPKIVIVIDDMGIDKKRTAKIIALPPPLTLSFLTYASYLSKQTRAARKAGHEIMLHVAMEPENMGNDPGPNVLLRDLEPDEIEKRLMWGLGRIRRYVGINNHMGSKFTEDRYGMTIVMKELRRRGLLFLDSRTTNKSVGGVIAHAMGVPYAERNIFLDNVNELGAVQDRLAELEGVARRKGHAIAIGHPRDATIEALATWLDAVKQRGFVVVPLTAVVHKPKMAG